ncbi:hypothetical protein TNCV_3154041 [Trichonephila clavipes]|nr:hypothetical protein TNCV_3154041 [Trichonephila clavipes]
MHLETRNHSSAEFNIRMETALNTNVLLRVFRGRVVFDQQPLTPCSNFHRGRAMLCSSNYKFICAPDKNLLQGGSSAALGDPLFDEADQEYGKIV